MMRSLQTLKSLVVMSEAVAVAGFWLGKNSRITASTSSKCPAKFNKYLTQLLRRFGRYTFLSSVAAAFDGET